MLKTLVKVGEVSNLSDARYCAGMGVEMLGFLLDTEKAISLNDVKEITNWIEGCKFVAEFKNSTYEEVKHAIEEFSFDFVQVSDISIAKSLKVEGIGVILESNELDVKSLTSIDYVITSKVTSDLTCSIFSGDITLNNLEVLVSQFKGINLLGGDEIRPGFKDFDELADILEALEID